MIFRFLFLLWCLFVGTPFVRYKLVLYLRFSTAFPVLFNYFSSVRFQRSSFSSEKECASSTFLPALFNGFPSDFQLLSECAFSTQ